MNKSISNRIVCSRCKKNPPAIGFSQCQSCRDYSKISSKNRRLERINSGKCAKCGAKKTKKDKDNLNCTSCMDVIRYAHKKYKNKKIEKNFCHSCCKERVVVKGTTCEKCKESKRINRQLNKQKGLCECGDRLHTKALCLKCFTKKMVRINNRKKKTAAKILKTLKKRNFGNKKDPYGFIYKAICHDNNKVYIGQTIDFDERQSKHIRNAFNQKENTPFYRALRKYGKDKFSWEVIHDCYDKKELNYWEWHYINKFDSFCDKNGYNVTDGVLN